MVLMRDEIHAAQADIWIHGHSHSSKDYYIGKTRIINNPRGYSPGELNKDFIDNLIIEV